MLPGGWANRWRRATPRSTPAHPGGRRSAAIRAPGSARRNRPHAHRCRWRFRAPDRFSATTHPTLARSARGCATPPAPSGDCPHPHFHRSARQPCAPSIVAKGRREQTVQIDQDSPRVRFPPPLIYLGALLIGVAVDELMGARAGLARLHGLGLGGGLRTAAALAGLVA